MKSLSSFPLLATPWTVAYQAPLSVGFSRQEYWSGLPFPSPGEDLPNPGIEPRSPALQADSLPSKPSGKPQSVFSYINEMSFETSKVEGFPGGSDGKASAMLEIPVRSLVREDPVEKEMATHSSILAWRIPRTEEPGRLQPMRSQESDMTE